MIDNASKSITLGERMSPETVWNRFGISPLYSHDDTELLNSFVEVYKTGDGLLFSCLNSLVHDFEVTGNRYRIIIFKGNTHSAGRAKIIRFPFYH